MSCLLYPSCLYPRVISSKCKATSRLDVVPSGRFLDRAILYANLDRCHTRWQANNAIPQFAIGEASGSFPLGLIASGAQCTQFQNMTFYSQASFASKESVPQNKCVHYCAIMVTYDI